MKMTQNDLDYDVLIVGAGIAGSSLACALSNLPRPKPFRIALLERSLAEPDRIVGEFLQPGGCNALKCLGLESCLEGIDSVRAMGYCVMDAPAGDFIHVPYLGGHDGRSFHHGKVITNLRNAARSAAGVNVIKATVTDLIENKSKRVIGVRASREDKSSSESSHEAAAARPADKQSFYASLVVVADGCLSNLRTAVMGHAGAKPITTSYSVGLLLKDVQLPMPNHGLLAMAKGYGPAVLYQISEHNTRLLVDVKVPLPSDLKSHLQTKIVPHLPPSLQLPVQTALDQERLRRMPNSFLPPVKQSIRPGVVLLGDSWNMRHPLTGGGMTVAYNDVVILRDLIGSVSDLKDWSQMKKVIHLWHWRRKPLSSTINILSLTLYEIFSGNDEETVILRAGWFKYLGLGGMFLEGPVSLLSGITPSPLLLALHFLGIVMYSIWMMFTHPMPVQSSQNKQPVYVVARVHQYPSLSVKAAKVFLKACVILAPLAWSEVRWWAPTDTRRRNSVLGKLVLLLLALMGGLLWTSLRVM